jgi:hypothetical protein
VSGGCESAGVTRKEAEAILGIHPQQMQRGLDRGWFQIIECEDGRRLIKREGLEEAWANRPRQRVKPSKAAVVAPAAKPPARRRAPTTEDGGPLSLETWELPKIPTGGEWPRLEEQKGWREFTNRYRDQLALLKDAGLLVYREDYDKAHNAARQALVRQCELFPKIIGQRIPKLTVEDIEEIEDIIREGLTVVSALEFEELDQ